VLLGVAGRQWARLRPRPKIAMVVLSMPINEEIMSCMNWREVLDHVVRRFDQMDEVNAVTSLHRAAKLYREECEETGGRHTPLEEVHRAEGLRCLFELVWHLAVRCRPQQLSNSAWACAVLLHHDATLLRRICDYAAQRLGGFTTQNVANTVWALGTLGYQHDELLSLVVVYAEINFRDFSPQDLANMIWAFARLQRPCDRLFQVVVPESLVRLDTFQAQNMSNLIWGCATILYRDESTILSIASMASKRVEEFSTQELSNLTWGMATLNLASEAWLEESGAEMARRSRDCCPQDLSNTIWAYGTLKYKRNEHLRAINWEVMRQIELFSPQGLSNVAWGLSAIEYRDIKTLVCISEEVIRRPLDQMMPPDISTLLYSFAVLAWMHEGALAKLRRAVRYSFSSFASRDVANVSWALVTLSHRDDEIFRMLFTKAVELMPEFSVQGLCNIAWAFVRFGIDVPRATALGIAEQTVSRRAELDDEPGDALLLSDAVCSEWSMHVPKAFYDECHMIGWEQYATVLAFLEDMSNIPALGAAPPEVERYQCRLTGLRIIQLGRRLTVELLRRFGMLEESWETIGGLRPLREQWLLEELTKIEPTDASLQHKTTCAWELKRCRHGIGAGSNGPQIAVSGTPMNAETRFVSCVVEHPRASDAEFQVVNRAAEHILSGGSGDDTGGGVSGILQMDVSEIPCLSCLGALRQFQKAFPGVTLRVSFSIRKVSDVCADLSLDTKVEPALPPSTGSGNTSRNQLAPDNRGRSPFARAPAVPPRASSSVARRTCPPVPRKLGEWLPPPATNGIGQEEPRYINSMEAMVHSEPPEQVEKETFDGRAVAGIEAWEGGGDDGAFLEGNFRVCATSSAPRALGSLALDSSWEQDREEDEKEKDDEAAAVTLPLMSPRPMDCNTLCGYGSAAGGVVRQSFY